MPTLQQKQSWEKLTKLSQHESLSSHWTIALSSQGYLVLIFLITALHLALAGWIPLTSDEVYYWNWAQNLKGGYLDGPPMVAYWIAFSTSLFGDGGFGIRFFACVGWLVILWILGSLVARKFVLTLFVLTPMLMLFGLHMGPEVPLVLFWMLYLVWLRHINVILSGWEADPVSRVYRKNPVSALQWILGGVLLGMGILSQYTMLLVIPCTLLMFVIHYRAQAWMLGFFGQLLIASLVAFTLIRYNQELHFEPFLRQWDVAIGSDGFSFSRFFSNVWLQTLLIGAAPILLLPWVMLRPRGTSENPALNAHFYLYIIPAFWFGYKAFTNDIDPLWPLVASLAFWSLAERGIAGSSFQSAVRILVLLMFIPALVTTGLTVLHPKNPWSLVTRPGPEHVAMYEDGEFLNSVTASLPVGVPVFSPSPVLVSQLRYRGLDAFQFAHSLPRSEFSLEESDACHHSKVLVIADSAVPTPGIKCFSEGRTLKTHSNVIAGKLMGTLDIVEYQK